MILVKAIIKKIIIIEFVKNKITINLNNYSNYFLNKNIKNNNKINNSDANDDFKFYRINSTQISFPKNKNNNNCIKKKNSNINDINDKKIEINNLTKNNDSYLVGVENSFKNINLNYKTKENSKNNINNEIERKLKKSSFSLIWPSRDLISILSLIPFIGKITIS